MLKSTVKLHKLTFNDKKYKKDLETGVHKMLRTAAKKWLQAVLTSVRLTAGPRAGSMGFPVYTGMAIASFGSLAREVGVELWPIPVRVPPTTTKSPGRGRSLGKQNKFITIRRNQYGPYSFELNWWTKVPHFELNELNYVSYIKSTHAKSGWHSLEVGNEAVKAYLTRNVIKHHVPHLKDYITKTEVKVT
jgi:hypothetical protein